MKIFQKGFNYSQDGPGNRLVYHLQGCNFRCPWCSNPEGMASACSKTADLPWEEIYSEILRCRPMFFDGGGVTFTGGEATLQMEELLPLCRRLQENGISVCLETNGSHPQLPDLWAFVDFLIMDIKHFDASVHRDITGIDGNAVYANLEKLTASGKNALIRIPLVNGYNADPDGFVSFFSRYNCENLRFELLPYHEYGRDKWTRPYTVKDGFITAIKLNEFTNKLKKAGLRLTQT